MSKIEHVSLNSEDEILDRVNSETLNYSGLYSKNSENENFETCSHLYLTYPHRTINLIDFSGGNVKTDIFRVRNFYFRLSTASRYRIMGKIKYVPGRRTKPKTKVYKTKNVRLDIPA